MIYQNQILLGTNRPLYRELVLVHWKPPLRVVEDQLDDGLGSEGLLVVVDQRVPLFLGEGVVLNHPGFHESFASIKLTRRNL